MERHGCGFKADSSANVANLNREEVSKKRRKKGKIKRTHFEGPLSLYVNLELGTTLGDVVNANDTKVTPGRFLCVAVGRVERSVAKGVREIVDKRRHRAVGEVVMTRRCGGGADIDGIATHWHVLEGGSGKYCRSTE